MPRKPCIEFAARASLVLLAMFGGTGCERPIRCEANRNVVLIVVDTLRADHLGAYGYSRDTSPQIDAFAREALLFRNAYTPRPKTTPAIASVLTGLSPRATGITNVGQALPAGLPYLPGILERCGYATAAVVSNGVVSSEFGFQRDFDRWQNMDDTGAQVTDAALEALAELADRPFFLWVHYLKPHARYAPPPPYHEMFVGDALWQVAEVPFGDQYFGSYRALPRIVDVDGITNPHYYVAEYDAEIRDVDAEVGRLFAALRERGLFDESVIALISDHGESLGEHGYYFGHGMSPYDATAHVPLLLRVPGQAAGETKLPASLLDLAPTLLAAVGVPAPDDFEGIDLLAALDAGQDDRVVVSESGYREPQISIRRRGAKLIYVPSPADRERLSGGLYEFYRTDLDPGEQRNLAGQGDPREAELRAELEAWRSLPRAAPLEAVDIEERVKRELRALGYAQ